MTTTGDMTVSTLTGADVITLPPATLLTDVANALFEADIGAVLIGTLDDPIGVVSERDSVIRADASSPIAEVAAMVMTKWIRHVDIEEGGLTVGVVSAR